MKVIRNKEFGACGFAIAHVRYGKNSKGNYMVSVGFFERGKYYINLHDSKYKPGVLGKNLYFIQSVFLAFLPIWIVLYCAAIIIAWHYMIIKEIYDDLIPFVNWWHLAYIILLYTGLLLFLFIKFI